MAGSRNFSFRLGVTYAVAAMVGVLSLIVPAQAAGVSEATRLLFQVPYLAQLQSGSTILYDYKRTSSDDKKYGTAIEDTIRVDVAQDRVDASKRSVLLTIFSGKRQREVGPFSQTEGNPAIMILLEQDTFELKRRIGGQPAYFRNKIRKALRDTAVVEATTINHNGREISAHTISIEPFKGDNNMSKTPDYASIVYRFVVSDDVPGGIVEISSLMPATDGSEQMLRGITMSFDEFKQQ